MVVLRSIFLFFIILCFNNVFTQEIRQENLTDRERLYWDAGNKKIRARGAYYQDEIVGVTNEKHGKWWFYDAKGNLTEEQYFYRGRIHGKQLSFHLNKKIASESYFVFNVADSIFREWSTEGQLIVEGVYNMGSPDGEWKYFYEDGPIQQKGNYVKNKPHGTWEWWYKSGQKRRMEDYENGKEKGFVFEYDTTGKVIVKGEYFYGLREGVWKYEINDYREKGSYIGGMKTGKWKKTYTTTKKDKFKGEYLNDIPIGKHVYYYSNGQIKTEGKYKDGEKDGEWIYYNELGDIVITYLYKDGREFKRDGVKVKY